MSTTFIEYELRPEWQPGYIILSYVIATLGSMVSLELMKQRTGVYGLRNWMLLLGGSIALGAIGIWSMHFIGMMALTVLDANGHSVPMAFTPGLTVLSALLPIIIVAVGFLIAGDPTRPKIWKNLLAGCAGGIGVSVMHYIGMLSMVLQVRLVWNGWIIFASVMVGIVAATAAMFIFFRFGKLWRSDLRLQFLTSGIMGVAVCGMHYTGMQSVKFYSSPNTVDLSSYTTRDQLLITILVATGVTLIILVSLRIYYRTLLRLELEKSQCLTLQVILLDSTGSHIYVGPTGAPPSAIIEKAYVGSGELNQANQNFLRMFRTSLNWELMEQHLQQLQQAHANTTKGLIELTSVLTTSNAAQLTDSNKPKSNLKIDSSVLELYSKFVTAAKDLSTQLNIPIELFGKIYFEPYNSLIYIVFAPTSLIHSEGATNSIHLNIAEDRTSLSLSPSPSSPSTSTTKISRRRTLKDQLQKAGTSFRFQQVSHFQQELKQYLRLEEGDGEPQQYLQKLVDFYHKASMPIIPSSVPSSLNSPSSGVSLNHRPHVASPTLATTKTFLFPPNESSLPRIGEGQETVVGEATQPLKEEGAQRFATPSLPNSPTSTSMTHLHLALYYSQASGKGLQVMVPAAGPYAMIPTQPMSLSENETPLADTRMLLRDLMSVAQGQSQEENLLSTNVIEGASTIQVALQQVGSSVIRSNGTPISSLSRNVGRGLETSHRRHASDSRAAPLMSPDSPSPTSALNTNPLVSPIITNLRAEFFNAARQLSDSIGTVAEFTLRNLHPELIEVAPNYHMIVFVVCKFSPIIPEHLRKSNTFLPLPMFEILHRSALSHSAAAHSSGAPWTRSLLTSQLTFQPGQLISSHNTDSWRQEPKTAVSRSRSRDRRQLQEQSRTTTMMAKSSALRPTAEHAPAAPHASMHQTEAIELMQVIVTPPSQAPIPTNSSPSTQQLVAESTSGEGRRRTPIRFHVSSASSRTLTQLITNSLTTVETKQPIESNQV